MVQVRHHVNAIAPGYILTQITKPIHDDPDRTRPSWTVFRSAGGAAGRLVGPFLFLGSEAAEYIHGSILPWTAAGSRGKPSAHGARGKVPAVFGAFPVSGG